jgi:hypothetical protein
MLPADADAWGWRIPFVGSIVFMLAGYLLRRGIHETEQGLKAKEDRTPVFASLMADWRPIVQTFGIVAMTNAAYYLTFTFAVERRKEKALAAGTLGAGDFFSGQHARAVRGAVREALGR